MQGYCRDVVPIQNPHGLSSDAKLLLQLRSLVPGGSFDRLRVTVRCSTRHVRSCAPEIHASC